MKTLELNEMENLEGGTSCSGGYGFAAGLMIGGLITAISGGTGIGAGIYLGGAASLLINKTLNPDCGRSVQTRDVEERRMGGFELQGR